ncbi:MAG TPA: class I adenylate-forming enzyme family protein [Gammaproteobacteria bacterium]|nr:class I adenylate-forming enzyme family protein [Gammaproteobacteria bacterium]
MTVQITNLAADASLLAISEGVALSRAAFWQRVHGLERALVKHPARRWALVCDDSGWFAAGFLALANLGRELVLPQAPQAGSLSASGTAVDAVLTDRPRDFQGFTVLATEAVPVGSHAAPRLPDDASVIEFYTSGSSGAPKSVPKAFGQLRLEVEALERQWGPLLGNAIMAGTVPHYHLYGLLFRVLWPLFAGRAFLIPMCLQPAALRATTAHGDCAIVSSPAFLSRIADYAELPPAARVKAVFSSGAPLSDAAARELKHRWGHAAIEVYGSTETGGIGWRAWSGPEGRALWRPILGAEVELREEAAGARLWVKSGCTWRGEWSASGDLAKLQADGRFELLGRADDVVKFEDKRVSLAEMRTRLMAHGWVEDARLLVLPGRRRFIGAVVALNAQGRAALAESGKPKVSDALREWLRQSYEALLIPRKWRYLDVLPGNDMGKVERVHLEQLFESEP